MRINQVQSARKEQTCGKCRNKIKRGDPYRWAKSRYGPKMVRCTNPACGFRPTDLSSSKTAQIEEAIEDAQESIATADNLDDIKQYLQDVADIAREVGGEYREASDQWAQGQGHEEWTEKADACESFADDLESWEPSSSETGEEEVRERVRDKEDGPEQGEDEDQYAERLEALEDAEWESVLQSMREEADEALNGFSI